VPTVSHSPVADPESVNEEFSVGINLIIAICGLLIISSLVSGARASANAGTKVSMRTAAQLYSKHCASCHGKDGRAKTFKAKFNHARNLTEPGWQEAVSDERIFNSIANGRGKKMPSFAKKMSEAEIDSLVVLVRGLRSS
jgi:mono/diheme cytochrome c family protein